MFGSAFHLILGGFSTKGMEKLLGLGRVFFPGVSSCISCSFPFRYVHSWRGVGGRLAIDLRLCVYVIFGGVNMAITELVVSKEASF